MIFLLKPSPFLNIIKQWYILALERREHQKDINNCKDAKINSEVGHLSKSINMLSDLKKHISAYLSKYKIQYNK